jgi:hypothetical protein
VATLFAVAALEEALAGMYPGEMANLTVGRSVENLSSRGLANRGMSLKRKIEK